MTDLVQPILVALLVLLVPASVRFGVKAISKKLDEGRVIAETRAAAAEKLAEARHMDNVRRFDAIEVQTTSTNGKVAEHDKQITALAAQNELLIRLFPGPKQLDGGKQ